MSAISPSYREAVVFLEADAAQRFGTKVKVARPILARELGLAPGTLENIRNGRTKGLRGWIERRIDAALVRALERRIAGLNRELALANARVGGGDQRLVSRTVAARDALVALMAQTPS